MTLTAQFITDEVTVCDCCGKDNLKATVAMLNSDNGLFYYGRTCAARNSGKASKQLTKEIRTQQQHSYGRAFNKCMDIKRSGTKLTADIINKVAAEFRNDTANTALLVRGLVKA